MTTTMEVDTGRLVSVAEVACIMGDTATAERVYQLLMYEPSQETRLEARFQLAMLKNARGELKEAAVLLSQILDHRPNATRTRLELAGVLNRMGDKEGAWRQMRAIRTEELSAEEAQVIDYYSDVLCSADSTREFLNSHP
ncbi:MAG: tetratricopeptide repeat protein [Sphingomicrobium sp.]